MTRLRRSRLAGALVALGMIVCSAVGGTLLQRIVYLIMICATSLADKSRNRGTGAQTLAHASCVGGEDNWLRVDDNWELIPAKHPK